MSGIYIKGMEMPKGVRPCPFASMDENWKMVCIVGGKHQWHKDRRCDDCPLIEVPEHGRLIDADSLKKQGFVLSRVCNGKNSSWQETMSLDNTPTIIPADKEK